MANEFGAISVKHDGLAFGTGYLVPWAMKFVVSNRWFRPFKSPLVYRRTGFQKLKWMPLV